MATLTAVKSNMFERASRHRRFFGLVSLGAWFLAFYVVLINGSVRGGYANYLIMGLLILLFIVVNVHIAVLRWTASREWRRALALLYSSTYLSEIRGLPGREAFLVELAREMARSRDGAAPFTLGIVSFESLENIRQQKGEHMARRAIKQLAERVMRATRASDLAAYVEEGRIAVLLTDCLYEDALQFVRRIPCEVAVNDGSEGTHQFEVIVRLHEYELREAEAADVLRDAERAPAMQLIHVLQRREAA